MNKLVKEALKEAEEKYLALKEEKKSAQASRFMSLRIQSWAMKLARGEITQEEFNAFVEGINEIKAKYGGRAGGGGTRLNYQKVDKVDKKKDGVYIVKNGEIYFLPNIREENGTIGKLTLFYKTVKRSDTNTQKTSQPVEAESKKSQ